MSEETRRRVLVGFARAEDALTETHVQNVFDLIESVGDEMDLRTLLEDYFEAVGASDEQAAIVVRRVMSRLEQPARAVRGRSRLAVEE